MTEASMAPLFAVRSASEIKLELLGFPVDELSLRNIKDVYLRAGLLGILPTVHSRHSEWGDWKHQRERIKRVAHSLLGDVLFDTRPERPERQNPVTTICNAWLWIVRRQKLRILTNEQAATVGSICQPE